MSNRWKPDRRNHVGRVSYPIWAPRSVLVNSFLSHFGVRTTVIVKFNLRIASCFELAPLPYSSKLVHYWVIFTPFKSAPFNHSMKLKPSMLISWSTSGNILPNEGYASTWSGIIVNGCGCPSGSPAEHEEAGEHRRLTTSKQRLAKRLLSKDGCDRSAFVVSTSCNQDGKSGFVGSVMMNMIGITPAWKRKYLEVYC